MKNEIGLELIKEIGVIHQKLLIPIVFSGIFTPLIVVGYFSGFFHPIIALLFIISGVFIFYVGWLGEMSLVVSGQSIKHFFPLNKITENLNKFIEFTNNYIKHEPVEKRSLYAMVRNVDLSEIKSSKIIDSRIFNNKFYNYFQSVDLIKNMHNENEDEFFKIIMIDPLRTGTEIKYVRDNNSGQLYPVPKGSINAESIIKILEIEDFV